MSEHSAITWTQTSWNPVTGCDKVSAGCAHCYAQRFAEKWRGIPGHPYEQGFDLKLWPERLDLPLRWRAPRLVFVNSMSDLFHQDIPISYVKLVFATMKAAHRHTFQVLTKRSARLAEVAGELEWAPNIWMGVTVESRDYLERADHLRRVPAAVRFISAEPLLGPLGELGLEGIDWLIAGGETGPQRRPMRPQWVRSLRDTCRANQVAFSFKQWSGRHPARTPPKLDGTVWKQLPQLRPHVVPVSPPAGPHLTDAKTPPQTAALQLPLD